MFESLPGVELEAVFLPVNGVGNNMNMADATKFAKRVNAKYTVPFHIGMFDDLTAKDFECENKVVPKIFGMIRI